LPHPGLDLAGRHGACRAGDFPPLAQEHETRHGLDGEARRGLTLGFGKAGMNSFNHYAYGAVLDWMYGTMAGIRLDPKSPGWKHFILAPIPDRRVGSVNATYDSPYGKIKSSWKFDKEGKWSFLAEIPANTSATVVLPGGKTLEAVSGKFSWSGKID